MENSLTGSINLPEGRKAVIIIENLSKQFGNHKVLVNLNLTVFEEENVVILGKSGCGKSVFH